MVIRIEKKNLISAINAAQKAVPAKSNLPVLEGLHMQVNGGKSLNVTGNNTEMAIRKTIPCTSDIDNKISFVVNSKLFGEIIKRLDGDSLEIHVCEKGVINIIAGNSKFDLKTIEAKSFPDIPKIKGDSNLVLETDLLRNMIKKGSICVGCDENRPALTGVLIDIQGNLISCVSCDGFHLARFYVESSNIDTTFSAIIPAKTISDIGKLLTVGEVKITKTSNQILFEFDNTVVSSRLIEGKFINYMSLLNSQVQIQTTLMRNNLISTLDRVNTVAMADSDKSCPVKISISEKRIAFNCESSVGIINDIITLEANDSKEEIVTGFNPKFMSVPLQYMESEKIKVCFIGKNAPVIIEDIERNDFIYLLQGVRI